VSEGEVGVSSGRHFPGLDGIRGFFALTIIAAHSIYFGGLQATFWGGRSTANLSGLDRSAAKVLWWIRDCALPGMDVFFVLSSFLITGILLDSRGGRGYFANFYARRFLRILPLYYLTLAVLIALQTATPSALRPSDQIWFWVFLSNHPLAKGWNAVPAEFHHFWSLAVEEQFYLLWPFAVRYLEVPRLKLVCISGFVFALAFRAFLYATGDEQAVYTSTLGRLDQLAVGAFLAIRAREPDFERLTRGAPSLLYGAIAAIVALAAFRGTMTEPDAVLGTVGHSVYALFGGALVGCAVKIGSRVSSIFEWRPFRLAGRHSYALYLFHQPVVLLVSQKWHLDFWHLPRVWGVVLWGQALTFACVCLGVFVLAGLSWWLVESPFLRLKVLFPRPTRIDARARLMTGIK